MDILSGWPFRWDVVWGPRSEVDAAVRIQVQVVYSGREEGVTPGSTSRAVEK